MTHLLIKKFQRKIYNRSKTLSNDLNSSFPYCPFFSSFQFFDSVLSISKTKNCIFQKMHSIVNMLFQNKPEYVVKKVLKDLHKTFSGATKKCENTNLTYFLFQYNFLNCTGREELIWSWTHPKAYSEPSETTEMELLTSR